jgi:4-hydroxy-tetrahydrodipicolinate reductase
MKIALLGYGSMGHEIEAEAKSRNFQITEIFDIDRKMSKEKKYNFDVAIDFTYPGAVVENVETVAALGKNIIIGTTGWWSDFEKVKNIVLNNNISAVYGSNFSVGMHLFSRIVEHSAKLLNNIEDFDIFMHEIHHKSKKDSPSGTAMSLARLILENYPRKKDIYPETSHDKISQSYLHVTSTRGGEISGTHTVYIDSSADTIELTHRAKNRTGFAKGALEAAVWLDDKKGFFAFEDIMADILRLK